jgi:nuclear mRNA export protein PCID2/THP1
LGVMPKAEVGSVYGLTEFVALGAATIRGDIGTFDRILHEHQASFVRLGVYLVLEQVKMIAYRNLFLKIFKLQNSTRLNLHTFVSALRWMNQETDLDEVECVLTNLIYQNRIKGYISHEKRFLIVSKTDPFPKSAIVKLPVA